MINKLTEEQKAKLKEYRDKYVQIGLNTDRINREECKKNINNLYTVILKWKKPRKIIFCESPYQLWHMLCLYKVMVKTITNKLKNRKNNIKKFKNEVRKEGRNEVGNEVGNEVRNEVENEVRNEVWNEVRNEVWNEVRNEVWNEVRNEVENEVRNEVWNEVRNEVENEVWKEVEKKKNLLYFVLPYLYGQYDSYYFSFYCFMRDILKIKYKKLNEFKIYEKTLNYGLIYPLKKACFISEKPIEINRKNKKLHANYKPALKFSDGFSLWRLNGIKVPKWVVMTKPEKMDIKKILGLSNIEQRIEAIKKMGEYFLKRLNADCIDVKYLYLDTQHKVFQRASKNRRPIEYRLLKANIGFSEPLKILKMDNASIPGKKHYEMVEPKCETVLDAFESRTGIREYPVYLS